MRLMRAILACRRSPWLAPERTLYVSSLSKTLSPGLRIGFLVAPAGDLFNRCMRAMGALMHSPAGVSAAIATDWIESGRADDLARDVRAVASDRTAMALGALEGMVDEPQDGGQPAPVVADE